MRQPGISLSPAEREIVEYGRISGWAVAAILLGVLSAAAIVGPLLWFIPVSAGAVSIVAMRKINASESRLSGWHLALLGLLLAIFFGVAGPARTLSRQYLVEVRAAHFAEKFLDLLQHKQPLAAYQLALPAGVRAVVEVGQTELKDKSPEAKKAYDEFLKLPAVNMLLEAGAEAKIEPLSATFAGGDDSRDDVIVKYRIRSSAGNDGKSADVLMDVNRSLAYGSHTEQWQILWRTIREE
ncbi:MAG TPA: hypothetical protein VMJ32_05740 [Pirellulales bacterium]|nr:hypothetical protein [Pirellulales bacterium]